MEVRWKNVRFNVEKRNCALNILLIDPPTSHEQIYGDWDLSAVDTYCPSLGLLSIAAVLRKKGHKVRVFDPTALKLDYKSTIKSIIDESPDIVGITAKTINIIGASKIVDDLKGHKFNLPIIIGGAHITAVPLETMSRFLNFDYGVIGEGEVTFVELTERIADHAVPKDVAGLVYRDENNQPMMTSPRELIKDLDSLPFPAWDLLPNFPSGYPHSALETKKEPAASIMTSRGCPFQCAFCDNRIFGQTVRHHSAEYVLEMVRYLRRQYNIRDLMVLDDNFILDKERLFKVCDGFIKEKMNLSWYCMGHTKFITEDRMKKIKEAGCWILEVGIESGCDRILKFINKKITKDEVARAVITARRAGLKIKGNFIFGFPTETKDSLEETIRFATSIRLTHFQQNFLTVWPGCRIAEGAGNYGVCETDWSKLAHQRITFVPNGLTKEDLVDASKAAFRRFYLRPGIILGFLASIGSWRAFKSLALGGVVFVKTILRKSGTI